MRLKINFAETRQSRSTKPTPRNARQILAWFLAAATLLPCQVRSQNTPLEMITDGHFQKGLLCYAPATNGGGGPLEGTLHYPGSSGTAIWHFVQYSKHPDSLFSVSPVQLPSPSTTWKWQNYYRTLYMGPTNSTDAEFEIALNSDNEYGGVYQKDGNFWPGLLVAQSISAPGGNILNPPSIGQMTEATLNLDALLTYTNIVTNTAQFVLWFTIQQLNPPGHGGNYLWFGTVLYDSRTPLSHPWQGVDQGTGKVQYDFGLSSFVSSGLSLGQWKHINGDFLPFIKDALNYAWAHGSLTNSSNYNDYYIGGMNMGWEMPGLCCCSLRVKNFGVGVFDYNHPKSYEFNTNGDREGWMFNHLAELYNGPQGGTYNFTASQPDPQFIGPTNMHCNASTFKKVAIRMANAAPTSDTLTLYWQRSGDSGWSSNRSQTIGIPGGGGWGEHVLDMTANPNWNGDIIQIRIDPLINGTGYGVGFDYVRFQ